MNRYIPVLRCKDAEWKALGKLGDADWDSLIPLVEIVPKELDKNNKKTGTSMLAMRAIKEIPGRTILFDSHHTEDTAEQIGKSVSLFRELRAGSVNVIPVVHVGKANAFAGEINKKAGLRISTSDLSANNISTTMARYSLRPENVHLVLDCGLISSPINYAALEAEIPHPDSFASITLLAGSFPRNLTGLSLGIHELPRLEWANWEAALDNPQIQRRPGFGDYTIQHAEFFEPPTQSNPSASIRYTASSNWVVVRGQGLRVKKGPGYKQYIGNARLLAERDEFCGSAFSAGDDYMHSIAQVGKNTGNPGSWLFAGINHHLAFVSRQVRARFET